MMPVLKQNGTCNICKSLDSRQEIPSHPESQILSVGISIVCLTSYYLCVSHLLETIIHTTLSEIRGNKYTIKCLNYV